MLRDGEWSVSFQSRFGPAGWLKPYTQRRARRAAGARRARGDGRVSRLRGRLPRDPGGDRHREPRDVPACRRRALRVRAGAQRAPRARAIPRRADRAALPGLHARAAAACCRARHAAPRPDGRRTAAAGRHLPRDQCHDRGHPRVGGVLRAAGVHAGHHHRYLRPSLRRADRRTAVPRAAPARAALRRRSPSCIPASRAISAPSPPPASS